MIEDASALALAGVTAEHIQPRFEFDPKASHVLADRIQIQQVIVNLMRNALEAMAGAECQEFQLSTALVNANVVEIAIADAGPGISEEIVEHLFEPFVSTKHDGMGLGLSICQSIVEAHAGKIRTEPNPRGGTIFRFTLPLARGTGGADGA
jgi:C4-dicarboxylate-specific signal transduction histidine kinase